jgi:hypothetical protein
MWHFMQMQLNVLQYLTCKVIQRILESAMQLEHSVKYRTQLFLYLIPVKAAFTVMLPMLDMVDRAAAVVDCVL